jgi:glycerol-3-phosphate dehydrogenase (NAD(P)+)
VVGAGSWGTTLADLLARNGHDVAIWAREEEVVEAISKEHVNPIFLPDCPLSPALVSDSQIGPVVADRELVVCAAPSHAVRTLAGEIGKGLNGANPPVVSVAKGLEPETMDTMTQILEEVIPDCPAVTLSGPSFAKEVYERQPTAVVAAATDMEAAETAQRVFSTGYFRVYTSPDVLGVQLGGALKNVVAIAAGIVDGLGLGHNPRAALITRGLAEMTRLGEALGANPMTFAGLAGMGDLILTATGSVSRNRSLGFALGQGRLLADVLAERRTVAEGVNAALVAVSLGERTGVELPIASEVEQILFEDKKPQRAIQDLMERELKAEHWR